MKNTSIPQITILKLGSASYKFYNDRNHVLSYTISIEFKRVCKHGQVKKNREKRPKLKLNSFFYPRLVLALEHFSILTL